MRYQIALITFWMQIGWRINWHDIRKCFNYEVSQDFHSFIRSRWEVCIVMRRTWFCWFCLVLKMYRYTQHLSVTRVWVIGLTLLHRHTNTSLSFQLSWYGLNGESKLNIYSTRATNLERQGKTTGQTQTIAVATDKHTTHEETSVLMIPSLLTTLPYYNSLYTHSFSCFKYKNVIFPLFP